MKAVWTSTTPALGAATLGDDSVKVAIRMEQLGVISVEQVEQLFAAPTVLRLPRGNAMGDCAFTAHKTHASRDAAAAYFQGEQGRVNQQGTLVLTFDVGTLTMTLAVLREVRVTAFEGLSWTLRYVFGITTIV